MFLFLFKAISIVFFNRVRTIGLQAGECSHHVLALTIIDKKFIVVLNLYPVLTLPLVNQSLSFIAMEF